MPIRTERLNLLSGTTPVLDAGLKGRAALSQILDIEISKSWPPPLYDAHAISWMLGRLQDDEVFEKWGFRYFVRRQESGRGVAVGAGGFKGPPSADGSVEIGYSVLPEFQRHGFATEAARGLLQRAYGDPGVEYVVAETLSDPAPSIAVLHRIGFELVGDGSEPGVIPFEHRTPLGA